MQGVADEGIPNEPAPDGTSWWDETIHPQKRPLKINLQDLAVHNFPAKPVHEAQQGSETAGEADTGAAIVEDVADAEELVLDEGFDEDLESWREDLWLYRNRTQTMLRRYLRFSLEVGRVPSILGKEFFRSKVSSYTVATFEDRVIFVYDMERSLEALDKFSRELVERVVLQEHHPEDLGRLLGCGWRTIYRRVEESLDRLSEILLERGLMERN